MKKMHQDKVFARKKQKIEPFRFNREVTRVFDDMLVRSVPLYRESIKRQAQLTAGFYQEQSLIFDLGCSNGNLGLKILDEMQEMPFSMVAVDSSISMIETYAKRLEKRPDKSKVKLVCGLIEDIRFKNVSVTLINLTLQFLKPACRNDLIRCIYEGMKPGALLLLTEKIEHETRDLKKLYLKFYQGFKKENGYSELEISQKREALEQVLIPDSLETHMARLKKVGFSKVDVWLKWFNFASIMAFK